MTHYIIAGGPFQRAYAKLAAAGWKLNLQSAQRPGPEGGRKQEQVHLRVVRTERLGKARPRDHLRAVRARGLARTSVAENVVALVERHQMLAAPEQTMNR